MNAQKLNEMNARNLVNARVALASLSVARPIVERAVVHVKCPRCKVVGPLLERSFHWTQVVPFVGLVDRYSRLCGTCPQELDALPNKTWAHRSRKGRTTREQSVKARYTLN